MENTSFINEGAYNLIVEYHVNSTVAALFDTTPYNYSTLSGHKGGTIFNAARANNMWYTKDEGRKGRSYGFPGLSTIYFNASLVAPPKIYKNIK